MEDNNAITFRHVIAKTFYTEGPRAARALIQLSGLTTNDPFIRLNLGTALQTDSRRYTLICEVNGVRIDSYAWATWLLRPNEDEGQNAKDYTYEYLLWKYRDYIK